MGEEGVRQKFKGTCLWLTCHSKKPWSAMLRSSLVSRSWTWQWNFSERVAESQIGQGVSASTTRRSGMWWDGLPSSGAGQSPSIGSSCSVWPQNHSRTTVMQRWRPWSSRHAASSNAVLLEDMFSVMIGDGIWYFKLSCGE